MRGHNNMPFMKILITGGILVLVVFLFAGNQANAQLGITITPLKFDISASPGEKVSRSITVINPNDFRLSVEPRFRDFRVLGENAGIQWLPPDIENPYKMSHWITLNERELILQPKEEKQISFSFQVPEDASAGGHYAAIIFRGSTITDAGGALGSFPSVGALIILNVEGDVIQTGEVIELSGPRIINKGPVTFKAKFINTGTAHYKVNAVLSLRSFFGPKDEVSFEDKILYPQVNREVRARWEKKRPLGPYLATLKFTDGEGNVYTKKMLILGFPWRFFLAGLAIVIALAYILRYLRKRFRIVRA